VEVGTQCRAGFKDSAMNSRIVDWNTLTFGLYQEGEVAYGMKAVITEEYAESLENVDGKIIIHKLDQFQLIVTVYDAFLQPIDITLNSFVFTVRERNYDRVGKILFQKKTGGEGIEFIDAQNGVIGIDFLTDDLINAKTNIQYNYELEILGVGSDRLTIMTDFLIVREV